MSEARPIREQAEEPGGADPSGPRGGEDRTDARARDGETVRARFKTRDVVDLLDISRRQLQYWAKTGLIEPSERTPGGHHRYSFDDLVALKATKRLLDAGVSVQKIRSSVRALQSLLPQVSHPLSELVLVATGDVVLVFRDDTVFEAISGQEWVFEVAGFEREVARYRRGETHGVRRAKSEVATRSDGAPRKPGPRKTVSRQEPGRKLGRAG
ncbi:MAG: MerR family transcriptional regulator [Myxococcales bacterium]|nr:MerR family transcriptional regulator [Myxococcales bacterium]